MVNYHHLQIKWGLFCPDNNEWGLNPVGKTRKLKAIRKPCVQVPTDVTCAMKVTNCYYLDEVLTFPRTQIPVYLVSPHLLSSTCAPYTFNQGDLLLLIKLWLHGTLISHAMKYRATRFRMHLWSWSVKTKNSMDVASHSCVNLLKSCIC